MKGREARRKQPTIDVRHRECPSEYSPSPVKLKGRPLDTIDLW